MAAYKRILVREVIPLTFLTKMIILGVVLMGKCNTCSDHIDDSARKHSLLDRSTTPDAWRRNLCTTSAAADGFVLSFVA
jgi:hypothetical protein